MKPGKKYEWYTPPEIFRGLNVCFDLDPCHPNFKTYVPTKKYYTIADDGLIKPWAGRVWMNPPFGGRNGYFKWIDKFIKHNNGIGLFTSLTSSAGFHKYIPQMDAILFPEGKTRFYGKVGKLAGDPFNGVVLFALGRENVETLKASGLGIFFKVTELNSSI